MVATSLITLIGAVIYLTAASGSDIQSLNTCSCLGQTVSFECVVTGGTLTVWSGTAFNCQSGEISLRHGRFMEAVGSCNSGAIIGRGITSEGNQYTSRLNVTMSNDLVGRTVTCSVDDIPIGSITLEINNTNIFLPPSKIVVSIEPEEIFFNWDTVPHDGCPSFRYDISAMNCGTCTPSLTTSTMSTCTNFTRVIYPNTKQCVFGVQSTICTNINGTVSTPIHVNLTVPGPPSVKSVPYYRTSILEEIQTSFNTIGSFRISDSPVIDGDAESYTITYAETTTGATCYSDTIMASSCKDGTCQHSYFFSDSSCLKTANITVTVFETNVLGDGRMSTPINISGVNTFVSVTFNASTRTILCNFSKILSPSESHKQCIVNVTYGAECDQLLGTYTGTGTESSNLITSSPLELISGVSEYCISVNATRDNETVVVEKTLNFNFIQPGEPQVNNAGYVAGVVVTVFISVIMLMSVLLVIFVVKLFSTLRKKRTHDWIQDHNREEYYLTRKESMKELDLYSHNFLPHYSIKDFCSMFNDLDDSTEANAVNLIGRVNARGKNPENNNQPFLEVKDVLEGTMLTINTNNEYLNQNGLETTWNNITKGDLVGVIGRPMRNNEKLCMVLQKIVLISPCLRQVADSQSSGTVDRERLDPMVDDSAASKFVFRTKMISFIKNFLNKKAFQEVDTPMVNVGAGGAAAKLIKTGYTGHGLNQNVYMCLTYKHYHKVLVLKGFHRVYEIGKHFNEEKTGLHTDDHDPEFTTCKFCCAFTDYNKLMILTESMISEMVNFLTGKNKFDYCHNENVKVDFKTPFPQIRVIPELQKQLKKEFPPLTEFTTEEFKKMLNDVFEEHHDICCPEPRTTANMLKELIEHFIVKRCISPTFVIDYPQILCPFAKEHDDDKGLTEHFELIICKQQICNGYTLLIDPVKLRKSLQQQKEMDERYYEVLEYGLPPCVEWKMGIDQMTMLLTASVRLQEVIIFPPLLFDKKTTPHITKLQRRRTIPREKSTPSIVKETMPRRYTSPPTEKPKRLQRKASIRNTCITTQEDNTT